MRLGAWYWRLFFFALTLTFGGMIAYSRMFLGVHSLNQCLYGLTLGAWFAISSEYLIKEPMMQLIHDLINVLETKLSRLALMSSILLVLTFTLQIFNFEAVKNF